MHLNVSMVSDHQNAGGCGLRQSFSGAQGGSGQTVHLPFDHFSGLLTYKLLRQLDMIEADTVVEASSQNVTCFLWPSEKMYQ